MAGKLKIFSYINPGNFVTPWQLLKLYIL